MPRWGPFGNKSTCRCSWWYAVARGRSWGWWSPVHEWRSSLPACWPLSSAQPRRRCCLFQAPRSSSLYLPTSRSSAARPPSAQNSHSLLISIQWKPHGHPNSSTPAHPLYIPATLTFVFWTHNLAKCWPILKVISPAYLTVNLKKR